jgi:hypothetical protein
MPGVLNESSGVVVTSMLVGRHAAELVVWLVPVVVDQ